MTAKNPPQQNKVFVSGEDVFAYYATKDDRRRQESGGRIHAIDKMLEQLRSTLAVQTEKVHKSDR